MPTRALIGITITILIFTMSNTMMAWAAPDIMTSQAIKFSREDQTLTAHIDKVPLREVLQVLANRLSISITLMGSERDNRLSTTFSDLPLEQGIERLLQGQDYALLHISPDSFQLKEIFVLPRQDLSTNSTRPETMVLMSPTDNRQDSTENLKKPQFSNLERQKLELAELVEKIETLVQLSDQSPAQSVSTLTQATKDEDLEIKEIATALLEQLEFPSQ